MRLFSVLGTFKRLRTLACLLLLAVSGSAPAAVLIDDFSTPQLIEIIGVGSASNSVAGGGIVGGERDATAAVIAGLGMDLEINQLGFQLFAFSEKAITSGNSLVTWDGSDNSSALNATGLGGIDLTDSSGNGKLVLSGLTDDLPVSIMFAAYTDGSNYSTHTLNLPGGIFVPTDFEIPYSAFSVASGSGADFSNIGALQMFVDGIGFDSVDLTLSSITAVPEPSTLSLLGLGVLGAVRLGGRRRRR